MLMTPEELRFHQHFMRLALREAEKSVAADEVPCGCVIVALPEGCYDPALAHPPPPNDPWTARVLARAYNQVEMLNDPTAHAEMIAITAATATLGDRRLNRTVLYVTKEPCPMCAGAIVWARPDVVVWGLSDPDRGGESVFNILSSPKTNHRPKIFTGILETECKAQFTDFFKRRRNV